MRKTSLLTAAVIGACLSAPAFAQSNTEIRPGHVPGVGDSEPASTKASNIDRADARSTIAPRLPVPEGSTPDQYLRDAEQALSRNKTGLAQEAMERAETGMLDRSVPEDATGVPDQNPRVHTVRQALDALGRGDKTGARRLVGEALAMNAQGGDADQQRSMSDAPRGDHMRASAQPGARGDAARQHGPEGAQGPQLGTHSYAPGGAGDAGSTGPTE